MANKLAGQREKFSRAALERALHGILRLKGRQVEGAGAEWFVTTREEVLATVDRVLG